MAKQNHETKKINVEISTLLKQFDIIFKKQLDYYQDRLNRYLTETQKKEVYNRVYEMFNFHLSIMMGLNSVSVKDLSNLEIPLDKVKNKTLYKFKDSLHTQEVDLKNNPEKVIFDVLCNDFEIASKYCVLGEINVTNRIKKS